MAQLTRLHCVEGGVLLYFHYVRPYGHCRCHNVYSASCSMVQASPLDSKYLEQLRVFYEQLP